MLLAILAVCAAAPAGAQSSSGAGTPASAILTRALAASTGGAALTDVTIQAQATWTAGSDHETGTATLEATSRRESLVRLTLSGGTRQWVRGFGSGQLTSPPAGAWTGTDGNSHAIALHNCWTPAAWFFPAVSLSAATRDPQIALADLGALTKLGGATEHLQLSRVVTGQAAKITTQIEQLSTADLYLDSSSLLPVVLDFNLHPDNNAGIDLPVEVRFSDYRSVAGIRAPFRIQEYLQ